jgi:hypothetical protein
MFMRIALTALCTIVLAAAPAAGRQLGLGFILGEPTGLSAKAWLGNTMAVDAAAAWSFLGDAALHVHADALYHNFGLLPVPAGELPFYIGVGGRVKLASNANNNVRLGVRVPVGLEYVFEQVPLGAFIEVVPLMDIVPATRFNFNGAVGIRYYLF